MERLITIVFLLLMLDAVETKAQTHTNTTTIEYSITVEDSIAIWAVLDSYMENFREPLEVYLPKQMGYSRQKQLCYVNRFILKQSV